MRYPFGSDKRQKELAEELRGHMEMATLDRMDRGEAAAAAGHAVRREFGNIGVIEQVTRDQWGWGWFEEPLQDLHYGMRMLGKNPGFTVVAILTLALGIGANASIFSVVNGVLLNPLPYPHPEQLVTVDESKPNFEFGSISFPNFKDWRKDNRSFASIAVYRPYAFSLTGLGEPEQVRARFISSEFFSTVGVNPVLGRDFAPGEDEVGGAPIALITAGFWARKFGSSTDALGKTLTLDGKSFTIVGVVPAKFDLFLKSFRLAEIYVPIGQWTNPNLSKRGAGLGIHGVARLKPGVTIEQARADMSEVTHNLAAAFPDDNKGVGASLLPLRQATLGDIEPILLVLFAAVVFVLLIGCVNIANLLLARSTGRSREFAIRAALGAGRGRILRQLLTESLLLALLGGALGVTLAQWATQAALKHIPADVPRAGDVGLDWRVLLFSAAVSLMAGVVFGLAPALKMRTLYLQSALKEGGRGASSARNRAQSIFVVAEMAMALVLLIGAGLMIRTMKQLWSVDPGFRPENVLTFGTTMPPAMMNASPSAIRAAIRELDERIAATPGVRSVAQTWEAFPLGNDDEKQFWMDGQPKPTSPNDMNWTIDYVVGPRYLETMGIPLQRGRFFTPADNERAPLVVAIDEEFARKYFGTENPLGKGIVFNDTGKRAEIVGIVGHVAQWGLDADATEPLRAQVYIPCMQMPDEYMALVPGGVGLVVRGANGTAGLLDSIRNAIRQMSSQQVVYGAETVSGIIAKSLAARQFSMLLLGVFALVALILSAIGIYGVISYLVSQRTQEIGIRVALGANRWNVLRLVLGESSKMGLLGVFIGIMASIALTRVMTKMLYGVSATDPLTFFLVATTLLLVASAASYIPARRAMRVDPIIALRYE